MADFPCKKIGWNPNDSTKKKKKKKLIVESEIA